MANKISPDDLPQSQIYENGEFYSISIADLKGNEVAIMQLINDYNTKVKTIERLQNQNLYWLRNYNTKMQVLFCNNSCNCKCDRLCDILLRN